MRFRTLQTEGDTPEQAVQHLQASNRAKLTGLGEMSPPPGGSCRGASRKEKGEKKGGEEEEQRMRPH
jgi:hypothetical protein